MELHGVELYMEKGQVVQVEDDALGVIRELKAVSPRIHVFFNEQSEEFDVVEISLDGEKESLVFSVKELDARAVTRLKLADHWRGRDDPQHVLPDEEDAFTEQERLNDQDLANKDAQGMERLMGEAGERLAHALEEDGRGTHAQILIPRSLSGPSDTN